MSGQAPTTTNAWQADSEYGRFHDEFPGLDYRQIWDIYMYVVTTYLNVYEFCLTITSSAQCPRLPLTSDQRRSDAADHQPCDAARFDRHARARF
jgi:hypothetical protein